jgi:hypothetical protein
VEQVISIQHVHVYGKNRVVIIVIVVKEVFIVAMTKDDSSPDSKVIDTDSLSKEDFDDALGRLLTHIDSISRDAGVHGYVGAVSCKGRRYYRIEVVCRGGDVLMDNTSLSLREESIRVWGFVEVGSGDVLLPASRSSPAKHARGNIFDRDSWKRFEWTGPQYLI